MKVFLISKEDLIKNLKVFPYSEFHRNNIVIEYDSFMNFLKTNNYLIDGSENVINSEELDTIVRKFIDSKQSLTYKNMARCCLKVIFNLHNLPFDRSKYPINNFEEFEDINNKILTFEEFKTEINNIYNESEKLICYLAYKNLLGDKLVNIRFAKVSDIDFCHHSWKLYDGTLINFGNDELMIKLLQNTIKQKEYIPYDKKNKKSENGFNFPDSYYYNMESPYLFKTRNHPRSDNGLAPYSKVGLEIMFTRLSNEFGNIFNRNNLKLSGFINLMYEIEPEPTWTVKRIEKLKEKVGMKASSINVRVFFLQKYFPEVLIQKEI